MSSGYDENSYYAYSFGQIPNKARDPTTRPNHPDYKGPEKYDGMRRDGVKIVTPPTVTLDENSKDHDTEDYEYRWRKIYAKEAYPDNKWTVDSNNKSAQELAWKLHLEIYDRMLSEDCEKNTNNQKN